MVTRWTRKIVAFLHDPPGKALVLRSVLHTPHVQLAEALQRIALGRPTHADEKDRATKADHIASAADRVNFPAGATAYWDKVDPTLTHPLSAEAQAQPVQLPTQNLQQLDDEVQEEAGQRILQPWVDSLKAHPDKEKRLYFHIWRLLYEDLARRTSLKGWVRLLPADTRQPDHPLEQHLSISAAIADALPKPAFLIFSLGPVQEFIAAARRTQDLWMGSWILSYLSWKAMERLADEFGPDVIVFPSLRGQPLCDWWLNKTYGLPCQPVSTDLGRPTFPNRFLALLPAEEASQVARKAEEAVQEEWKRLARQVYNALTNSISPILPADKKTEDLWESQIQGLLEIYWVVLPWPGTDQPHGTAQAEAGKELAEAGKELYEWLCQPPQGENWEFRRIYETLTQKGNPNWGTVWSLLYDLADRAFNARKNLRNFKQAEETGDKCTQCGQRTALRSGNRDSREFWAQVAERLQSQKRYDIKPDGKERLCAVCTVKRFVQREVLEGEFGLRGGFPSTSEIAAAPFKKRVLEALGNGNQEVQKALQDFLSVVSSLIPTTVAERAVPYLEDRKQSLSGPEAQLAGKLLEIDGEWLLIESWTEERLKEAGATASKGTIQKATEALRGLYQAVGAKPSKYYALLYMDGDHMGRWLSGTHKELATFSDILHPDVRGQLEKDNAWQSLLQMKRLITPAVHAAISQALGRFALRLVPYIVEKRYPGRLIYAGGDDVLALVPLEDALAVARELRAAFSGHVRFVNGNLQVCLGDSVTGYVEWDDEMGPKATASIGMVFAHHLQPLDLVLQAVRRAEHVAKRRYDRNALAVEVLKRSGESITVGTKWSYDTIPDVIALLIDLIQRLQEEKISGKWPYVVQAEARTLVELSSDAQKAELRRLLMRQEGRKLREEEREAQAEELSGKLVMWAAKAGFEEMSHWLLVCSFIAKGGEV
jgi:CRISPR-associated protein Cmr2